MVVHGLPKDDGTNSELDQVWQLALETNGDPESITEVFRMGRKEGPKYDANGEPIVSPSLRPVRVKCNNEWTKRGLLTGQGRIKENHRELVISKFFIRDDLTEMQRAEDKKLRDKLKALRIEHPTLTLVIHDNQIMQKDQNNKVLPFTA